MPFFDLPLEQLQKYKPQVDCPKDFDAFWTSTLKDARKHDLAAKFERVHDDAYSLINVYDLSFSGFGGQTVKGWMIEPAAARQSKTKLPCVVTYIGYGGGRSLPTDHLTVVNAGAINLVMDTRGQGSVWSAGATSDSGTTGPSFPGVMTRGIDSREDYYYRRLFTDAARAIEAAKAFDLVDPKRIGVTGGSQGGGIAIAAAALAAKDVKVLLSDVPFLCHYKRAVSIIDTAPYNEITGYLRSHRHKEATVFHTLSYFDGVNFASRIKARTLFSVALMDTVCPPSTIYAAYNRIKSKKEISVYPYNGHEGGGVFHALERMRFIRKYL